MCGIAGQYAYNAANIDRDGLRKSCERMAARGPDGSGEWISDNNRVGFGHRRLAIIDVSDRAAQPMTSQDGRLIITYNGEIYNYPKLRNELIGKGYVFKTHSDTEVLLALYADKGEDMVHDLRGMFAIAIWDAQRESLFLARDPYGIKPLYYSDAGGVFKFASQCKALIDGMSVSSAPDPAGMAGFYLFGSVPEPFTAYRNIHPLPAGSFMRVDKDGAQTPRPYYSISKVIASTDHDKIEFTGGERQEYIRSALLDSVRHHLVADVPVGLFLSAGVDSGALLGLMREASSADIHTVTLSFEEFGGIADDEVPLARAVATHYGAKHTSRVVTEKEFQEDFPKIMQAMDQPSVDGINTWFVSKAAHELGLKVAISGLGGDELFGGYTSFQSIPKAVATLKAPLGLPGVGSVLGSMAEIFSKQMPTVFPPKLAGLLRHGGTYPGAYLVRRGIFMPEDLKKFSSREISASGLKDLDPFTLIAENLGEDISTGFKKVATLEASLYMRNQLLRDSDWASMAHSLEVRVPLVDSVLLETLAPVLNGHPLNSPKIALAQSPIPPLPEKITNRPKTGFSTPISKWLQNNEQTQAWKQIPMLAAPECRWARRWAYTTAHYQGLLT